MGSRRKKKEDNPWLPFTPQRLPGVQVVISAYNAEPWLERCLASVEDALRGFHWLLVVADDGSTDRTLKIAATHHGSAAFNLIRSFPKAANVSIAKNRAFELGAPFRAEFPAIAPMDADDEMTPARVRHLLPAAVGGGHLAVMGDYQYVSPHDPQRHLIVVAAREENILAARFGPSATLFHASLIPANGVLFREDIAAYADCALWLEWRQRGIRIVPVPGHVVQRYYYRRGSVSNPANAATRAKNIDGYRKVRHAILGRHKRAAK